MGSLNKVSRIGHEGSMILSNPPFITLKQVQYAPGYAYGTVRAASWGITEAERCPYVYQIIRRWSVPVKIAFTDGILFD